MTEQARSQSLCVIVSQVVSSHVSRVSARKRATCAVRQTLRQAPSVAARRGIADGRQGHRRSAAGNFVAQHARLWYADGTGKG